MHKRFQLTSKTDMYSLLTVIVCQVMSVDAVPEEHVYTTEVVTTTVDPDDSFNYTSVPVTQVAEPGENSSSHRRVVGQVLLLYIAQP